MNEGVVGAQQTTNSPDASPPAQAPIPTQNQRAPSYPPVSLSIPGSFSLKLEGIPQPSGGPGWFGSVFLAAIATGIASLIGIVVSADKRQKIESELQAAKLASDLRLQEMAEAHRKQLQDLEDQAKDQLAEKERMFQAALRTRDHEHQRSSQVASLGREDRRIEIERDRLRQTTDASEIDIEVSAVRLAREHGVQFANLINTFFDKLSSANVAHRELALLAISGFVEVDGLEKFLTEKFETAKSNNGDCSDSAKQTSDCSGAQGGGQLLPRVDSTSGTSET